MTIGRTAGLLAALWSLALAGATRAGEEDLWTEDFNAALDTAEKDGKDLLLDFTGSDWCPWCMKLHDEVFKQDAFKQEAPKQFVLVTVDFPRQKPGRAGNDLLQREFRVTGFPTLVLTDSKGRAYARTGYKAGGAEKFLKHLAELKKQKAERDELFAKAEKAAGLEKAKLLDQVLSDLDGKDLMIGYNDEVEQILKLDADGKGGLRKKYQVKKGVLEIEKTLFEARDLKGAVAKIDALVKDLQPESETKQFVLYLKARALYDQGDGAGMLAALQAALDADPLGEAGQAIAKKIQEIRNAAAKKAEPKDAPEEKDKLQK